MSKKILYKDNARRALERGMEIMVEAVSVTLGPKGRNVLISQKWGGPKITKDGVTVAKAVELEEVILFLCWPITKRRGNCFAELDAVESIFIILAKLKQVNLIYQLIFLNNDFSVRASIGTYLM